MDTTELAARIVRNFLVPAVEASDHHERWKAVNRAAGVMAGVGAAAGRAVAESLCAEVVRQLVAKVHSQETLGTVRMVLGPNGLAKRFAACVAAISDQPTLECEGGHQWPEGTGQREGPSEWTGGVVVELCPLCGAPGLP